MTRYKDFIFIFLIILFHAVGLAGFLSSTYSSLFLRLVPWHLLLMCVLIWIPTTEKNLWLPGYFVLVYISGFLIEAIGTNTGVIFGVYSYGNVLGIKWLGTPLLIGINWILVVFSAGMLVSFLKINGVLPQALLAALLVTLLDYVIEPVAIHFHYWHWQEQQIPFRNYLAWFAFSSLLLALFFLLPFKKRSKPAAALFVVQLLFFIILNVCFT